MRVTERTPALIGRAVLAAALAALMVLGSPAAEAGPSPVVTSTPNSALVDFQRVEINGSGFEPGALLEWFECRGGAVDASDCDGYNADFIDVDGSGNVHEIVYVDARIYLPDGTEVDCRNDPAGCEIGVGFLTDAGEWPETALQFDPTAPLLPPVTATVTPSSGFVEDQTVTVEGQHLSFREEMWVYLCAAGDDLTGKRCDLDRAARTLPGADGVGQVELLVRSSFRTPLGGSVDCRAPDTSCEVVVGWGFDPPPDRQAPVAVSFASAPTTSTTTVSTTTTSTAPPLPPAAPTSVSEPAPAEPVSAFPSFTG